MIPILCFSLCSTFVFLVPLLVLYFQLSRATSGALLLFFSCNFWCPFSCSTCGFLVQLLVPFLVLYFRFSRATSGALSRALLSVFSCNFWCPSSCNFSCHCYREFSKKKKKGEKHLCRSFPFVLIARAKPPFGLQPLAQMVSMLGTRVWGGLGSLLSGNLGDHRLVTSQSYRSILVYTVFIDIDIDIDIDIISVTV